MNVSKVLTLVSRGLIGAGLLLFVGLFAYGAKLSRSNVTTLNDGRSHVLILMFCSVAWCWLAGAAARTLATAVSWGRALPEIASIVGFGIFFAIPLIITSGASADSGPTHTASAAACAIVAVVVIVVAKIVAFVAYGAKDAVRSVEQVVDHVQLSIADARGHAAPPPPMPRPGFMEPSPGIFTPEPTGPDRTSPGFPT